MASPLLFGLVEMDSTSAVAPSPALNPKKGAGAARRGSNPNNNNNNINNNANSNNKDNGKDNSKDNSKDNFASNGTDSGITSPRSETAERRRPSISVSAKTPRSTQNQSQSNILIGDLKNVSLFAHLPQISTNTTSPIASITGQLLKNGKETTIHPAIIKLALAFADYSVMGAAERCRQMLLAFKQVKICI